MISTSHRREGLADWHGRMPDYPSRHISVVSLNPSVPSMESPAATVVREVLGDGSVRLSAGRGQFRYTRLRPGALLIAIEGYDQGQFGPATVDEAAAEFTRTAEPVRLFIDTRRASGPTTAVMETWTAWLAANRQRLERVVVLVPPESKLLHLTVSIAQHLSRTGDLLRICGERAEFEAAVRQEVPGFQLSAD